MNTFKDLFAFYQDSCTNFLEWLEDPWEGKDKQESALRLFAGLRMIDKLKNFVKCTGNYNEKTIQPMNTLKELFYDENNSLINLKDKGDASDLTCVHVDDAKHILVTTSKNLNKINVGKLDIDKILTNFAQYEKAGYKMTLCICVRNRDEYDQMKKRMESSNVILKKILDQENVIIIDWEDLNQAFNAFKIFAQTANFDTIINSNKPILCLKFHQQLGVVKTLRLKQLGMKNALWGHIQRSGKSYIIGGCIIADSKDKESCNYLVLTTAPNETIAQQIKVFLCQQLEGFNVVSLNGKNKEPVLAAKNIIVCSKQFLQCKIDSTNAEQSNDIVKTNVVGWLKQIEFDMRFVDESHNGGTTELAQKTLDCYGKNAFTVQITATYSKPINDYNIPKNCWILWDMEDIKLCKNIKTPGNLDRLAEKHGADIRDILANYSLDNIIAEYSKYPELWILTDELKPDVKCEIIRDTEENNYGWSPEAAFMLKQCLRKDSVSGKSVLMFKDEFQNEDANLNIWYRIFGKRNKYGIPDKAFPDDTVFMKRIEKICKSPAIGSRFIGDSEDPMIIMAFLPQNNIDKISNATIHLLRKHDVVPDYDIISINSKTTNNPKQAIEDARTSAKNTGKKGVIVLSGKQCSLGVSIDNCDIVLLLNNNMGFDMIYQMMFRCMTEGPGKKCGFVVDLNIHRVIQTSIIEYSSIIKPDCHPREAIQYILQERLINLNGDHWMPSFGNDVTKISTLSDDVYNIYASNTETALAHLLDRLMFKELLLTHDDQTQINVMFSNTSRSKLHRDHDATDDADENIKTGIEKKMVENQQAKDLSVEMQDGGAEPGDKEEKRINYMDILKHIIPLVCLLTIHSEETAFVSMFNAIENDAYIYNILLDQTKSWWGDKIDTGLIRCIINVYMKYMKDDKETNQIIRTVKELFIKNVRNRKELSMVIDKYLIPQELEKRSNAEVSTPFHIRRDMLDTMPVTFWETPKRVFEPCAGKGGFIIDIIDRFMIGLQRAIPDEELRYATIVEQCLYFSDINPTNIFICKLLVDPYNKHKLNYNEGDTIKLDIVNKWNITEFDAVIGNPPYNEDPDNTDDPHMKPIYQDWIYKFTKLSPILLFITPSKWFSSQDTLLVELRNYIKTCKVEFITHFPNDDVFKNVKIKGGVSYYIINRFYEGVTKFNGVEIDINKYDIILEPQFYKLIENLDTNGHFEHTLDSVYCSQGTFLNSKTEKEVTTVSINGIPCLVSKSKGLKRYIPTDKITKDYKYWKVATPAAAYKGSSGFADIYILTDGEVHSRSYISFKVDSKPEADSLYSYMKCKLPHVLLSTRKITHNLCNSSVFKWIPLVPLDRQWNDAMLFEYFKFDNDIVNVISEMDVEGSYTRA